MNQHLSQDQIHNLNEWLCDFNEQLIAQSVTSGGIIYWKTLEIDQKNRGKSFYNPDTTIYKGNGGIILYLLSMYNYSGEEKYLKLAELSTNWLLQVVKDQESNHFAFYTGKTGICYVLSLLFEATQQSSYLETAIKMVLKNQQYFIDHYSDDLLSGNVGNLFVLAKLHIQTDNEEIFDLLQKCLENLIDNIYISKRGLKWRYRPNYIDSLCGLSHGAAGIGFALTEIGKAYNAPGIIWLGKQAFEYENQYFTSQTISWPDFRIHPAKLEYPDSVVEPDKLMKGEEVSGWAHGSVGIALTRLRGFLKTGDGAYYKQAKIILDHIAQLPNHSTNFSLTNGHGSHAYLLAFAGYHLNNSHYTNKAYEIIHAAIQLKIDYGYLPSGWDIRKPDMSVFMGETGLACCMLQLLNPLDSGDLVLPSLQDHERSFAIKFPDVGSIASKIFSKYFPNTARILDQLPPFDEALTPYQNFTEISVNNPISPHEYFDGQAILFIEKKKMELEICPPTFDFLSVCYLRIQKAEAHFNPKGKFVLSDFVELIEMAHSSWILVKYRYGVEDFELTQFTLKIVKLISNRACNSDELYQVIHRDLVEETNQAKIKDLVINQLRQLYKNGIVRQVE